ncbi:hypothetical protein M8C21_013445, partial [Ambrosia artemisiifolia]
MCSDSRDSLNGAEMIAVYKFWIMTIACAYSYKVMFSSDVAYRNNDEQPKPQNPSMAHLGLVTAHPLKRRW